MQSGELKLDENTEVLIDWYRHLEFMLFYHGLKDTFDKFKVNKEICEGLKELSDIKRVLLNKMLIFSVKNRETKDKYLSIFNKMIERGENWNNIND